MLRNLCLLPRLGSKCLSRDYGRVFTTTKETERNEVMFKKVRIWDDGEVLHEIPVPYDDWDIDVRNLGFEAWAHDPSKKSGIVAYGKSRREALNNLEARLNAWIIQLVSNNG